MKLKPYPAYKDSGVPWLGEVPEHWEVKRGKAIFRCIDIRSSTGEQEPLTVSSERGVVPRSSATVTMFKAESYVGYKLCWPGDLVINSLWAWARGLGVSQYYGIVSSAYGVYRLRPQYKDYSAYIHELVRSAPFNWELRVRSKGIWISRLQLTDEAFLGAPFPLPPPEEQVAIVRFLDYVDRRIRRYIRTKQKLIKLLEEQKQVIIHRAVTRGLDPSVCLKPSGIDSLGEVPAHWEVSRLDRFITLQRGFDITKEQQIEGPIPVVSSGGISSFHNQSTSTGPGVLVGRKGTVGSVHFIETDYWAHDTTLWVKEFNSNHPKFVYYLLKNLNLKRFDTGSANPTLNRNVVHPERVPFPPVDEQRAIAAFLALRSGQIDNLIRYSLREIDLIREYRTRLIADVVTGKLDMRNVDLPALDEMEVHEDWDEDADVEAEEVASVEEAVDDNE